MPIPQTGESNYVGTISKAMGEIDWNKSAEVIERLIRGLNPWPSAYTLLDEKDLYTYVYALSDFGVQSGLSEEIIRSNTSVL